MKTGIPCYVDFVSGISSGKTIGEGLINVAEDKILLSGLKGPLEEGWQKKVETFVSKIPILQ